jgi:hypothetical protein
MEMRSPGSGGFSGVPRKVSHAARASAKTNSEAARRAECDGKKFIL